MSTVTNYMSPDVPATRRFNLRMILFAAVVLLLVGYPVYIYLDSAISGGIKSIGGGVKQVDLKAMSDFAFDQNNGALEDIPQKWRSLDGQRVVLYGEMWNSLSASDGRVGSFELCYSITKCCFSGPPLVQHFVKARVKPGKSVYNIPNLVKVTGTLHVKVIRGPEKVDAIYEMDVDSVDPA